MSAHRKSQLRRYVGLFCPGLYSLASRLDKNGFGVLRRRPNVSAEVRQELVEAHGSFDCDGLMRFLEQQKLGTGDVVMLHCSWNDMKTYSGTPLELIRGLRDLVGPQGTICMPTFFDLAKYEVTKQFDVSRSPSTTGIVSELFRRMPGVQRSCQLRSVAAAGPAAEYLLHQHHESPYPCSALSPYARFAEVKAWIVCLGTPAVTNTMFHCAEDMLQHEFPIGVYPQRPSSFQFRLADGSVREVLAFERKRKWAYFCDAAHVASRIGEPAIANHSFHAVTCAITQAAEFLPRILQLARQGLHPYSLPWAASKAVPA